MAEMGRLGGGVCVCCCDRLEAGGLDTKAGTAMSTWHRDEALKARRARTRDGRKVFELREAVLEGETVLIGYVSTRSRYRPGEYIKLEPRWWCGRGGWGHHGGDDLCDL